MSQWLTLDPAELDDASNVLLVAPEVREPMEERFGQFLSTLETTPERVVGVTLAKPAGDFLEAWRQALAGHEVSFGFVSTAAMSRSVAADAGATGHSLPGAEVTRLSEPRPLPAFHRAISTHLEDADEGTVLCFHSLTHLLEVVDPETAFRFLHVLLTRVRASGARAIFHIDGDIHDEETVVQLSTLFDLVVEFDRCRPGSGENRERGGVT